MSVTSAQRGTDIAVNQPYLLPPMTPTLAHPLPKPGLIEGGLARWREVLAGHYMRLSDRSRRLRFLSPVNKPIIEAMTQKARPAAVLGIEIDGQVRAVLEIFHTEENHAEIGLSVEDAYQGRGLGRRLFDAGLSVAADLGIETADFFFDSENVRIRSLVKRAGAKMRSLGGGEVTAAINIATAIAVRSHKATV